MTLETEHCKTDEHKNCGITSDTSLCLSFSFSFSFAFAFAFAFSFFLFLFRPFRVGCLSFPIRD